MAGDWIAWTKGLTKKREVLLIARELHIDRRKAAALCMEVWEWADAETVDGCLHGAVPGDVDNAVGVKNLAAAMTKAGWLNVAAVGLIFPNWDYWNSKSAKNRLLDTRRKQAGRTADCRSG
jgi:hypothetical protein